MKGRHLSSGAERPDWLRWVLLYRCQRWHLEISGLNKTESPREVIRLAPLQEQPWLDRECFMRLDHDENWIPFYLNSKSILMLKQRVAFFLTRHSKSIDIGTVNRLICTIKAEGLRNYMLWIVTVYVFLFCFINPQVIVVFYTTALLSSWFWSVRRCSFSTTAAHRFILKHSNF